MQRVLKVLVVVLAVGVLAAAALVIRHQDPVPGAGTVPSAGGSVPTASAASTSSAPSSGATSSGRTTPGSGASGTTAATALRTAFVGDGYTAGEGASSAAKGWAALVATRLGLVAKRFTVDTGGYAKPDAQGDTYLSLVPSVAAFQPELVVVSGGRNDTADDPDTLQSAATQLFAQLRAALPDATIVAVAPWWGDSEHPAELATVDSAVKAGVRAAKGTYLALDDPLFGHPAWMADASNPNDAGYRQLATSVAAALRTNDLLGG